MKRLRTWTIAAATGMAAAVCGGTALADDPPPDPGWTGVPHCKVPIVHGLGVRAAKRKLIAARCAVGYVERRRSSAKKGRVIFVVPKEGSDLAPGTQVDLFVSRGRANRAR